MLFLLEILISFLCITLVYIGIKLYKDNKGLPLLVTLLYWLSMLIISNLSLTGYYIPSYESQALLILGFISFTLGYYIVATKGIAIKETSDQFVPSKIILYSIVAMCAFFIIPMLFITISYILSNGYVAYLALTRWAGGDVYVLFDFPAFYFIFSVVIKPAMIALFFVSFSLTRISRDYNTIFFISVLFLVSVSLIYSTRIEILLVASAFFFDFLLNFDKKSKRNKLVFLVLLIAIASLLFLFSYFRTGGADGGMSIYDLFIRYVVEYHTVGFVLFDIGVDNMNNHSSEHYYSLISTTVSILLFPIEKLAGLFGVEFVSPAMETRAQILERVVVGNNKDSNAFYTLFYLFYRDGGVIGIAVMSAIFGASFRFFLNSYRNIELSRSNIFGFSNSAFCFYSFYSAILFPPQAQETYWFTLIFLNLLIIMLGIKKKTVRIF